MVFLISQLKWNEFFLPNLLIGALDPGSSTAGNWSRYNLCDIVTKASIPFVASTDLVVHFTCCCCISADSKVQASIKHETEVKPIQACRVYSGALDETHLSAINRQVFVVVLQIRAHSPQVPSSTRSKSDQNTFYSQAQTPYFTISPSTWNFTKLKSQYTLRFMGSLTWAWHSMPRTLHTSPPKLKVFS